jgi:transposase
MKTFSVHQDIWNYLSEIVFKKHIELSSRTLQERTYHKCRQKFKKAPSQIVIRAIHDVISTYKSIKSNHELENLKTFAEKTNFSIRLDKRLYNIQGNSIKLTTNGKQIRCSFNPYPKFTELRNQFQICDPLIFVKNNEVWLAVTFDDFTPKLEDNFCIGVDLGIKRTACTSEGLILVDKKYLKKRREIRYLKRQLHQKSDKM